MTGTATMERERTVTEMYEKLIKRLRAHNGWALNKTLDEAADAIEDLEFACNRYEKDYKDLCAYLPKWIPVKERLPEEDGDYLAYVCLDDNEPFVSVLPFDANVPAFGCWEEYYSPETYGWAGSDFFEIKGVTHWMPLPEPPTKEE